MAVFEVSELGVAMNPLFNTLIPFVAVDTEALALVTSDAVVVRIGLIFGNVALKPAPVCLPTGGDGGCVRIESL